MLIKSKIHKSLYLKPRTNRSNCLQLVWLRDRFICYKKTCTKLRLACLLLLSYILLNGCHIYS
uniref:Uncharacterized protein n=1 Tax=Anguilla anguilla TaxID=7936 RepID=A0A0E9QI49_ANGAN